MDAQNGYELGYIWLNRIFVKRGAHFRLWKTSDIRLSSFEVIVMCLLTLVTIGVMIPIVTLLMRIPAIENTFNLWLMLSLAPAIGWVAGRRLAKASPYSRYTGENIFEWLSVVSDRKHSLLARIVGRTVTTNTVETWIDGKPRAIEAVEWIGSARAPQMVTQTERSTAHERHELRLQPQVEPTAWVEQARRMRREHA